MMSDDPREITPAQARATFGAKFEHFAEMLGREAKEADIPGFACIVMTERGVQVVSGGTHEDWRPLLRRIAGRLVDEMGQHLIRAGIGQKPKKRGRA
jgi:hypothetical protein